MPALVLLYLLQPIFQTCCKYTDYFLMTYHLTYFRMEKPMEKCNTAMTQTINMEKYMSVVYVQNHHS